MIINSLGFMFINTSTAVKVSIHRLFYLYKDSNNITIIY